ncbi:MAG TPA: undecaprenyl-diphosphate phosphatase [Burkholderiaceae bacterium]
MDVVLLIKAVVMGIVEGLTEFLPVSSTGHLILTSSLLGLRNDEIMKTFEVVIQSGAILAIVIVYWQLIVKTFGTLGSQASSRRLVVNILAGFLPAAVIGFLAIGLIKKHLFNGPVVASAFIVGALVILWVERRGGDAKARIQHIDELTTLDALKVGFVQCFGMIPGTSRSGSTIIGGMLLGLSRQVATEFSFFLAIPTLVGASVLSAWKVRHDLAAHWHEYLPLFGVGFVVSFLAAWVCVRWLLRYVATHTFVPFAWYRIAFGLIVLATWLTGMIQWAD